MVATIGRDGDWITTGLLEGFGGGIEALVSTYNTAAQILVIGKNARVMSAAVNRVLEMKGGIVLFDGDGPCFELALPIGGIMSDKTLPELAERRGNSSPSFSQKDTRTTTPCTHWFSFRMTFFPR
jgi:adenine deaminase